jgi:hypothetical protein
MSEQFMTALHRAAFIAALHLLPLQSAYAQWQAAIGAGTRHATHTENDADGRRLVRESGWLPGIAFGGAYRMDALTWQAGAEWYRGDLAYRGQTQRGAAAASTTSTALASVRFGAAYALGNGVALSAAAELDRWKRDIQPTGAAIGLRETYRSTRFLAGAAKDWQFGPGLLSADAAFVLSRPERMHVGFSGLFDDAAFDTGRGHGLRVGAAFRPAAAEHLELRARYDRLAVSRSGEAPLTDHSRFAGTIAQPAHTREAFGLTLSYVF